MFVYYPEYLLCNNFQVEDINEEISRNETDDKSDVNIDVYSGFDNECCEEEAKKKSDLLQ